MLWRSARPLDRRGIHAAIYDPGSGLTVVRIAYSDETGIGGGKYEVYTVVAAIMVNATGYTGRRDQPTQWTELQRVACAQAEQVARVDYANELLAKREHREAPPSLLEHGAFKGATLLNHARNGDQLAIDVLAGLATGIRTSRVAVCYDAVHNEGYRRRVARLALRGDVEPWSPFEIAFRGCLESVENQIHRFMPPEHVLWVHDKPSKNHEPSVRDGLRALNKFWAWDHPDAARLAEAVRILGPICYAPAVESRMIQLSDVCCTLIAGVLRNDPVALRYFQLMQPAVIPPGYAPHFENEMTRDPNDDD